MNSQYSQYNCRRFNEGHLSNNVSMLLHAHSARCISPEAIHFRSSRVYCIACTAYSRNVGSGGGYVVANATEQRLAVTGTTLTAAGVSDTCIVVALTATVVAVIS